MAINLADRAVIVQLNISQWNAKKLDKRITEEIAEKHSASASVGNYNKSLLPSGEELKNVFAKTSLIRKKYYANTLPWGLDGTQLLPAKNYSRFMKEFVTDKAEWLLLVEDFVNSYDNMRSRAMVSLGSMYNEKDYPNVRDVQEKFDINIVKLPVPQADFRIDLSTDELTRIEQEVTDRLTAASRIAMEEAWKRLYDNIKHVSKSLNDPDTKFRDTLVSNTRDLCKLLDSMNILDDPDLEQLRHEIEVSIAGEDASDLRSDAVLRKTKALHATKLEAKVKSKMDAFMGAAQ